MRVFQNSGTYPAYFRKFDMSSRHMRSFQERRQAYINDRFGTSHLLGPILSGEEEAFFTNGDDKTLQRMWAHENGLPSNASLDDILLAQLEAHRAEVFYNLDPMLYGSQFVRRLPGCVKRTICWRAAPSPGGDFSAYDRVVCNFPSIINSWRSKGWKTGYLTPAHDPALDEYAATADRPIDILFVGGYGRHHVRRARILDAVARLAPRYNVMFCLDQSRLTRLAESPLGVLPSLSVHRRPQSIRRVSAEPVFGLDLCRLVSKSKIVLNGAIDMAGEDRGNMRCFEALGGGALMLSDEGRYPEHFVDGRTMLIYRNEEDVMRRAEDILKNWDAGKQIAASGLQMIRTCYSKDVQWKMFLNLL